MTHEATIRGDELQLLLNLPYPELEVSYPMTGIPLIRATQTREGVEVRLLATSTSFDESTNSGLWEKERPNWSDLKECFLASGATSYTNLDDFKKILTTLARTGHVYYAPDTNILYNGFLTSTNLIEPNKIILSGTVKDEVKAKLNQKHGSHHIDEMKNNSRARARGLVSF
jgi:hypothetical protein